MSYHGYYERKAAPGRKALDRLDPTLNHETDGHFDFPGWNEDDAREALALLEANEWGESYLAAAIRNRLAADPPAKTVIGAREVLGMMADEDGIIHL
jgi:hypothetical protein